MEPCLFRHGKASLIAAAPEQDGVLQWSHVFSDMVRQRDGLPGLALNAASMEPCLFRHGKRIPGGYRSLRDWRFNGAMSFQTW